MEGWVGKGSSGEEPWGDQPSAGPARTDSLGQKQIKRSNFHLYLRSHRLFREHGRFHNSVKQEAAGQSVFSGDTCKLSVPPNHPEETGTSAETVSSDTDHKSSQRSDNSEKRGRKLTLDLPGFALLSPGHGGSSHRWDGGEAPLLPLSLSGLLLSLSADYCSDSALLSAAGETRMTRLHFDIFCHDG